jgi:hypothetical protein
MGLDRRLSYALDKAHKAPAKRPGTLRCMRCKVKIKVKPQGRLPLYCSHSCRQRAYERAKWDMPHLVALRKDLATIEMRALIRQELRAILRQAGLLRDGATPPPMPRREPRPALRVVPPEGEAFDASKTGDADAAQRGRGPGSRARPDGE